MPLSVRTRFEIFKRDEFTCRYCGRRSPEVVLQVDHIVPVCDGGSDDPINLTTSCWDCNQGKSGVPLSTAITGEDPHARAIELLERKRQLEEYNRVLEQDWNEREHDAWQLWRYWQRGRGYTSDQDLNNMPRRDRSWLMNTLSTCPRVTVMEFIDAAIAAGATRDFRYVAGCLRNWRQSAVQISDAGQRLEAEIADLQRIFGGSREEAIEYIKESDEMTRESRREVLVEEVLLNIRDADYRRRHRGRCNHDPECQTFSDCVQREVRVAMGVRPSNGAPSL